MSSMGMSGMDMMMDIGGMDSAGAGLFTPENMAIARTFWYIIAAVVGFLMLLRASRTLIARWSVRRIRLEPDATPSRPDGSILAQVHATTTAIFRELSYGQPWIFKGRFSYFTPPSTGRCLVIAVYWLILLTMLFSNVMLQPDDPLYGYKWEKVGFRAAWVSVTQVPFIYCLACKLNVISLFSGISYERLNWFHRWASRTVFFTVIVHWSFFFNEWSLADFVNDEIQAMPMVIYGFAAWGVLGWMVLSSFGFFRSLCYEIWVLQHLAAAGVFLWLLYLHVPAYAIYNIWLAIAFIAFDQIGRFLWNVVQNLRAKTLGYSAMLEAMPGNFTKVTVPVAFRWKAGQHIYLNIPRIGLVEAHPFTVANDANHDKNVTLYIKAHAGFSRRLYRAAQKAKGPYRAFVSGPWGIPPNLSSYETIIFVCNSTGATFTLPLFQHIAASRGCAKNVIFCWVCREPNQVAWFQTQLISASEEISANGATVSIQVAVTDGSKQLCGCCCAPSPPDEKKLSPTVTAISDPEAPSPRSSVAEASECLCALRSCGCASVSCGARPSLESVILPAVEHARGETAVISCGNKTLTADVRSYVTKLSDERAVHKGTGAQGIYLWMEEYGW